MTRHEAVCCAAEAAVREKGDGIAKSCADQSRGNGEHFPHAGTAFGTLVANDNDVAGFDFALVNFGEGRFFAIEDSGGSAEIHGVVSRNFYDATFGGEIAFQNS